VRVLGYFGPAGTFTHQALLTIDDSGGVPFASVGEALDAVRQGHVDGVVVPIENSVEGGVSATLDKLVDGDPLVVTAEVVIPVEFGIYVRPGTTLDDVTSVLTHGHAAAQCRDWLATMIPDAQVTEAGSTAGAAKEVADPSTWLKAQPNLGATVSYETYQRDVERAEHVPAARNDILAKRFGIPMEGYTYFFTYEETLPHNRQDFWGMPCSIGVDLSQGDDFTAFTFLFPLSRGRFGVKTRCYISERTMLRLPGATRQKYEEFLQEGSLMVLEGTVLDMMNVYEDLEAFVASCEYDVRCLGFDPYNAKEFVTRWENENGPFGIEKVIQGSRTESVPLGEIKDMAEDRKLLFDQSMMTFTMGNAITLEDTNGNRKLLKARRENKIDSVAALMDAWVAYKLNKDMFD